MKMNKLRKEVLILRYVHLHYIFKNEPEELNDYFIETFVKMGMN